MRLKNVIFLILVFILICGCSSVAPTLGLRPEYPENRNRTGSLSHSPEILFVEVDSLQPTFRWETFPRPHDFKADKQGMLSRIKNVTYDLKIWRSENNSLSQVIYNRLGLPTPSHKIEIPLEPCAKYFWTIRARFELDSQVRVTEWGNSQSGEWQGEVYFITPRWPGIPNPLLYRFKTPCPKTP